MANLNDYQGLNKTIGGWLYLLCFALIAGFPIGSIIVIFSSYVEFHNNFEIVPLIKYLFFIDIILRIIVSYYSIRAGNLLWKIAPNAVKNAKKFLFIYLGYAIISIVMQFIGGFPSDINSPEFANTIRLMIQPFIYFAIWYWYLVVSKRVKSTYIMS